MNSEIFKVLMGKGRLKSLKSIEVKAPWRGANGFSEPFDAEQAELNKKLYPGLFMDQR